MAKIAVIAGFANSLTVFRGPLLSAFVQAGHEVLACAPDKDSYISGQMERMGVRYRAFYMKRTGMNPFSDFITLLALVKLLKDIKPDVVLAYTIKPVIYGSIAARLAGVTGIFSMITGLGYTFEIRSIMRRLINPIVCRLYRMALSGNQAVFFQNPDDLSLFIDKGIVRDKDKTVLINGSGVDLDEFKVTPVPQGKRTFLLIARLIPEKGILEFIEAARILKRRYPTAVFQVLGPLDSRPGAFKDSQVRAWQRDGIIQYLGETRDVRPFISRASVYVLPSYREGTPRTVLEAMAMARPIITSDAPGCRETVVDGENGFLAPVRNVPALVSAMERFLLEPELIEIMGKRGRVIAEEKYDVRKVNAVILQTMGLSGTGLLAREEQGKIASTQPISA